MPTASLRSRNGASTPARALGIGTQDPSICAKYTECLAFVLKQAAPLMKHHGVQADASTIAAMTATLFIERNRQGR